MYFKNFFQFVCCQLNFFFYKYVLNLFGVKSINFSFMVLALGLEKLSPPEILYLPIFSLNAFMFSICPWYYFVYLEFMSVQYVKPISHTCLFSADKIYWIIYYFPHGLEMPLIFTCWVTLCINTGFNFCPLDSSPFIFPVRPN